MTFEECRSKFSETELQQLQEAGQSVVMTDEMFAFDPESNVPDVLLLKFSNVFSQWIDKQGKSSEEIIRAYVTFLEGLGVSVQFKDKTSGKNTPRVVFDENSVQFLPTHKKYFGALLPLKNKFAYIAKWDKQIQMDDQGHIDISDPGDDMDFETVTKSKVIPAKCADTDLLMTLASAVEASYRSNLGYTITVYLPEFARAMGVQFETEGKDQKQYNLKKKLDELENIMGVLVEQKKVQSAFKKLEIDWEKNEMTFASPYLYSILDLLYKDPKVSKKMKNNEPVWKFVQESYLISSKINKARNKATTQIVYYIVSELHNHGIRKDSARNPNIEYEDKRLVTKKIRYKDIVKNAPILKESLREAEPKRRSQILRRAILGEDYNERSPKKQTTLIETYLREFTDVFNYWKDLTITVEPVSMKEIENCIILRHHGMNGDFEPRLTIPEISKNDDLFDET